jgi:ABC-type Mn2+/Zn2+ transport system ATPase subunit
MSTQTMLEARGLVREYRNGPRALRGVDLTVPEGCRCALLGPNSDAGTGKS